MEFRGNTPLEIPLKILTTILTNISAQRPKHKNAVAGSNIAAIRNELH
jgi:hypothetical protein